MSSDTPRSFCTNRPLVVAGVSVVLIYWLADALLDTLFLPVPLYNALFHPAPHELAMRLLVIGFLLAVTGYSARMIRKCRQQEQQLATALQDAELEKHRFRAIIEAVGDAISIQDTDMRILYQNQAHQDLKGDHVGEFCYAAYQQQEAVCPDCHLERSYRDGLSHLRQMSTQTLKGERYMEIVSAPLRDGSGSIVAGIEAVRDITERKRIELEVRELNDELEARAARLAEANRELEAFNYSLSHDLRSYITRISTASQVLEESRPCGPHGAFLVRTITQACEGMEALIEAMLTLSQVSHQGMQLEEVALSDMVREAALLLQQQDLERQVQFDLAPGLVVQGDRQLLKVAVENLMENAWKYTRGVEAPRIEFGVLEREGKRCFFVRDNGVGFSMSEKEKLFAPFQRLRSAKGFPGNGVGLATVERVVSRHGGTVAAEGEPGKGATIYFQIPSPPLC